MPEPSDQELQDNDQDGFIGRCISMAESEDSGRSHDANVAMCYSKWRRAKDAQQG
jgi:hypothetical protein